MSRKEGRKLYNPIGKIGWMPFWWGSKFNKTLREQAAEYDRRGYSGEATERYEIIELIESLQAQLADEKVISQSLRNAASGYKARLAKYDKVAAEYGVDLETMLTLAKSQIRTARDNIKLREQLDEAQRRADAAVELIPRGCYTCAHWDKSKGKPYGCKLGGCTSLNRPEQWQWRGPNEAGEGERDG